MYKSKLLELIWSLEKTELDRLDKFLDSPYFDKKKLANEIKLLMKHITCCYPDMEDERLSKENTYALLFPQQDFISGRLDRVMSNLLKVVEEFVIYEFSDLKRDEVTRLLVMARFYRQRQMENPFRRTIKKLKNLQQKQEQKENKDFYLKAFLIEEEVTMFESFYNHRKKDYNVLATLRSLDIYYLVNRLEYTCWLLAQNKFSVPLNVKENMSTYNQIIASFKNEIQMDEIPLLKVYHQGIQLIQSEAEDDEAFAQLTEVLEKYATMIPLNLLKELQSLCRNYCMLQYNSGRATFLEKLFSLYQLHLEQGYLHYQGGILPSTMRNIVVAGLRLEKYDWIDRFLVEYQDRIVASSQPREIYLFNKANYFFALKKYAKALDCLADRYEDSYYQIAAKRMELKVYYELKHEILEHKINAFKVYIFRISQKILPQILKEGNNNFIDVLRQIQSSKTLYNTARTKKLILKIQSKKSIAEKEWLLDKLKEVM